MPASLRELRQRRASVTTIKKVTRAMELIAAIVTEEGGEPVHLKAGDRMILRPGFKGTWEVVETTRKDYVIKV